MFGRRTPQAKPSSATPVVERRPLTAEDMEMLYDASEMRSSGTVPSIYDLEKLCQLLMDRYPVDARSTLRQLRWLMKVAEHEHEAGWSHPWDREKTRT